MNDSPIRIQCQIRLVSGAGGRKRIVNPEHPAPPKIVPGRTARASRLMALAIHFDKPAEPDFGRLSGHLWPVNQPFWERLGNLGY